MGEHNTTGPAITPGEATTWATMALSTLPHGDFVVAGFLALVAAGTWGLRRYDPFRDWVVEQVEQMEQNRSPRLLTATVRRLPVPRVGQPKLLRGGTPPVERETLEAVRKPQSSGISRGMLSLLGDDNPLEQTARKPSQRVSREVGAATKANRKLTLDDWVEQTVRESEPSLKVLSLPEVIDTLNKDIDDHPHIFIVGNSGAGKTVLAQLIVATRPGKVVILDPKRPRGWEGPKWGGLPYVSRDRDGGYTAMNLALSEVVAEMDDRYRRQETASEPFQQLTVVLDEAKNSVEESPELAENYRKIVSIGREVGVRLILISTTDRARKLGFDGEADSMESFTWVRMGELAVKVKPEVAERGEARYYHAVVDQGGSWLPFENELAFELVQRKLVLKPTKAWSEVGYNCQLGERKAAVVTQQEGFRPSRPAQPVVAARSVSTTVSRPVGDDSLLGALLGVNNIEAELQVGTFQTAVSRPQEVPARVPALPSAKSAQVPSSGTLVADPAPSAKKTLEEATREELFKTFRAWKLFTVEGLGKEQAILQGFGLSSKGRGYVRGRELFDAYALLEGRGLIRRGK